MHKKLDRTWEWELKKTVGCIAWKCVLQLETDVNPAPQIELNNMALDKKKEKENEDF